MSDYEKEQNLTKRLIKIISDAGFDPEKVMHSSFYELENLLSICHYRMTKFYKRCITSNVEIEEKLEKIIN